MLEYYRSKKRGFPLFFVFLKGRIMKRILASLFITIILSVPSAASSAQWAGYTPYLQQGWNLLGNSLNQHISVAEMFGDMNATVPGVTPYVKSVWRWNAQAQTWLFYSPQLSYEGNLSYAASKGYGVLDVIPPGEGYWVQSTSSGTLYLPQQEGETYDILSGFQAASAGWNLMAAQTYGTPEDINKNATPTPPQPDFTPANFISLWAWETSNAQWYFYSPGMSPRQNTDYAAAKGHLDFGTTGKMLLPGQGFWMNKPYEPNDGGKG